MANIIRPGLDVDWVGRAWTWTGLGLDCAGLDWTGPGPGLDRAWTGPDWAWTGPVPGLDAHKYDLGDKNFVLQRYSGARCKSLLCTLKPLKTQ